MAGTIRNNSKPIWGLILIWLPSFILPTLAEQSTDLIDRGFDYYKLKDYANAWKCFDLACKANPNSAAAYDARGVAEINLKNFNAAKSDFDKSLILDPNYSSAYMDRGMMYFVQKRFANAIRDFSKAIAIDPNNPDNYRRRAEAWKSIHNFSEAINDCNLALRLNPDFAFVYCLRANLFYLTHEYKKALADATKSIDLGFDAPFVRGQRGWDYYQLNQNDQAITDFQKAIALDPGCESAHEGLGQIYADTKQYQKSLLEFGKALSRSPDWAEGYYRRGQCYSKMGKTTEAMRDFDMAIKSDPSDPAGYFLRGDLNQALERYEQAKADYKQAIALEYDPTYRGTDILRHAYLCMQLSQFKEAIDDCTLLVNSQTNFRRDKIAAELYRVDARICLGQYKQAIEEISAFLKQYRDYLRTDEFEYARDSYDECHYILQSINRAERTKLINKGTGQNSNGWPPQTLEKLTNLFPNKLETKHFVFISSLPKEHLLPYGEFSEAYWDLINREFFSLRDTKRTLVCILPTKMKLKDFIRTEIGSKYSNALGLYNPDKNVIVLGAGTGIGVTTHEIMHKALIENSFSLEPWATEAIPTFFEKFYAYFDGDVLYAKFGFQHSQRLHWIGPKLTKLKLSDILSNRSPGEHENEERLVTMFLYDSGKFRDFLNACRTNSPLNRPTRIESVFDMPMEKIELLWAAYLRKVDLAKPKISQLPPTKYFFTKEKYDSFMSQNESNFKKAELPKPMAHQEITAPDPINAIRVMHKMPSNTNRDMGE